VEVVTVVFFILPILAIALLTGVESWLWKGILAAAVLLSWRFLGPAWIAIAVVLIIGIGVKNSLPRVSNL
jgi:hypothetical protein